MRMQIPHVTVDFFFYLTDFSPLFTMTLCIQLQLHVNYALLDDQGNKLPMTAIILFLSLFCLPPPYLCVYVNYLLQKIKLSSLYIVGPPFWLKVKLACSCSWWFTFILLQKLLWDVHLILHLD